MGKFIDKIKQFFRNLISKNKAKLLEAPKENEFVENNVTSKNEHPETTEKQKEKKEFFEIYNKIKNGQYNMDELTEEQAQKIIAMLNSEITLKKDKLEQNITELNILKVDNKINEKNRIFELYNQVKNENVDLSEIDRKDLLIIRKLLLEEAKLQDDKLTDEIKLLEVIKKVS